jgi:DNA-binding transcriptional LysR family regulator
MDTRYLQSFVAVVELGSMAEAARRLDVTPAAIAARVKALEEEIGMALVQRAGRSVRPTQAGLLILDRARNVLRDVRDLRAATTEGMSLGELRLGVFVSAMTGLLPPVLKRLYARYPDLSVYVEPGKSVELCRQVATGALDAALVVEPQFAIAKGCAFQTLLEEPLVVVTPRSMSSRKAHDLLANEPFIRYDRSALGGQLADRYLRDGAARRPRLGDTWTSRRASPCTARRNAGGLQLSTGFSAPSFPSKTRRVVWIERRDVDVRRLRPPPAPAPAGCRSARRRWSGSPWRASSPRHRSPGLRGRRG